MNDAISFCEVYDILQHLDPKLYNNIPDTLIKFIDENRDKNYKVNIDYSESINKQKLQKGTKIILSLIYRDYICDTETKTKLINKDKNELQNEFLDEKYSTEDLFKNKYNINKTTEDENSSIVEYKETLFSKILNKIKKVFHI